MKKVNKVLLALLVACTATCGAAGISACGMKNKDSNNDNHLTDNTPDDNQSDNSHTDDSHTDDSKDKNEQEEILKQDITGVTFANATHTYDGQQKVVEVSGTIPTGVSVKYTNNSATDAGVYNATATLSGEGYKSLTLNATLTIEKADIVGVTFSGDTFEYDGMTKNIYVLGNVPAGVTVDYTVNSERFDGAAEPGDYDVRATLSGKNYNTINLDAKLKITATEEMLYSTVFGGKVYFENNLDGNKLYSYSGGNLTKVSNDVANHFTNDGNNLYFYSESLFSPSIKSINSSSSVSRIYSVNADYLTSDGTYLYYAVNNILINTDKNGIYKIPINNADETSPVKLTADKADYLACLNGKIYYSNKSNGGKLYSIACTAVNSTGTAITEEKVSDIIAENGVVYFTQHTLTGSAIFKYTVSTGAKEKLCIDNGAYLTKVGNFIYYVNKDLITSNLTGKGIYRTSILGGELSGEKILEVTDGNAYFSLTSDGTDLYYYKLNDKHFYRYSLSSETETDIMQGFTPVEDTSFGASYSFITEHGGEIYYTALSDGSLYKYNPITKARYKIVTDNVSNVFFNGNYMYYSTYISVNYALWRCDLTTGETTKISSSRFENLLFTDECIYAIKVDTVFTNNAIIKMDFDGGNYTELYNSQNVHISSLELVNGKLYFCHNPKTIGTEKMHCYNIANEQVTDFDIKSDRLTAIDSKIYYIEHKADKLCVLTDGGNSGSVLLSNVKNVTELYSFGGKVYFTGNYQSEDGLYCYNPANNSCNKIVTGYTCGLHEYNGKLYYIKGKVTFSQDYPAIATGSDGNMYEYTISDGNECKIFRP